MNQIVEEARKHWFWTVLTALVFIVGTTYGVVYALHIEPLRDDNQRKDNTIFSLQGTVEALEVRIGELSVRTPEPEVIEVEVTRIATVPAVPVATPNNPTAQSHTSTTIPTPSPSENPPSESASSEPMLVSFTDDFSSNNNEWSLGSDSNGSIRISQSRLVLSPQTYKVIWIPVPNVRIDDEFYIQAQVTLVEGHFCDSNAGLVVGEAGGNFNAFAIGADCGVGNYVAFFDGGSANSQTRIGGDTLLHVSRPTRTIGLEALNGMFSFYIDGEAIEMYPIEQFYGRQVGLLAWDNGPYAPATSVAFDNVVVRNTR